MKLLGTQLTRNIERDMFDYLPKIYEDFRESRGMVESEAAEMERLNALIADILSQFYVDTATWGLTEWERICGLPIAVNYTNYDAMAQNNVHYSTLEGFTWDEIESKYVPSANERRSAVKSKLRGFGTMTHAKIAEICGAYTGGTVAVKEYPAEYRVTIEFTDTTGVPANMETLQSVLRDLMPAHLVVEYLYRYLRWNELDSYAYSWDVLDAKVYTWDEFQEAVI